VNDRDAQLEWEARLGGPAALAAMLAALAFIGQQVLAQGALGEDRRQIRGLPDLLLSVNERPGVVLAAAGVYAVGALLLIPVFLYLLRGVLAREAALPRWFVYLVYFGPVLFALAQVLGAIDRIDLGETYAEGGVIRGEAGENRADRLVEDNPNVPVFALSFAGLLGVAFMFVMIPLRARRVGLLSPFMGILGVVAGALLVLQLAPQIATIIVAFWLGALAALYLNRWPGGRGPAWESGRPEPWPSAAERRGLVQRRERSEPEAGEAAEPSAAGEPEPAVERPASRKRKRKRG
jgi:hypothetical protein